MKTPIFNIHDLILVLTLTVCLLLVIFQLLLSKQKTIAAGFLSGFFSCVAINAFCSLLLWNDQLQFDSDFAKSCLAFCLILAVIGKSLCLYFYVVVITRKDFQLRPIHYLHLLHFLLLLVVFAGITSDKLRFLNAHNESLDVFVNSIWHYLKFLPVIYAFAAALKIHFYKKQLQEYYSSFSIEGPFWLMLLTLGFALNWLWSLIVHLSGQNLDFDMADSFGIFDNYITFILVNALFIYSVIYAHQLLEAGEKSTEKEITEREVSSLDMQSIRDAMEKHQLYLKPNLTIEDFAKQVGIHYREVSSIINKQFNSNFFEFVNEYRVNKAKQMLLNPECSQMTILDILLACGFNSKSSFHRFFKRYTGMSAADFRKQSVNL